MRYYKNESRRKRQLLKIFTPPPRNGKFMLQILDPKNGFQVKFQTQERDTHGLRMQTWQVTPGVNSLSAFQRYVIFWGKFLSFQKLLGWGGGGGEHPEHLRLLFCKVVCHRNSYSQHPPPPRFL